MTVLAQRIGSNAPAGIIAISSTDDATLEVRAPNNVVDPAGGVPICAWKVGSRSKHGVTA